MKTKQLYTFILEFRGGTYCTQVKAEDTEKALRAWGARLAKERTQIQYLTPARLARVQQEIKETEAPAALKGVKNVWCTMLLSGDDSMLVNIVLTAVL